MTAARGLGDYWRPRIKAAAFHFILTLLVTSIVASLVLFIWFPQPFAKMVGGEKLLSLIVISDIVLGPVISLIIFNKEKPRRELITDYVIVGIIQLGALLYGVFAVSVSRPVFVTFLIDRFEVVTPLQLSDVDLARGEGAYAQPSWLGPKLVYVALPSDVAEHNRLIFLAAAGKDAYLLPEYYRPYAEGAMQVIKKSEPLEILLSRNAADRVEIEAAVKELKRPPDKLAWVPIHHRFGFWTAIIDVETGYPVKYLPIDPY